MKLFIITGASKGLGASLLTLVTEDEYTAISISRTKGLSHPQHLHIRHDLSKTKTLSRKLDKVLSQLNLKKVTEVILINNAALIGPIGDVENFEITEMENHLKVNLLTPMVLSGYVMERFNKTKCPITIVNITSGAAFHPIINWSQYCSSKSGLKMFTECLNLDYSTRKNFKAISFSPGVMDTHMQATIRNQSKKNFKNIDRFKQLKQKKELLSSDMVAERLYTLIKVQKNLKETHYDIRDL